MTKTEGRVTTIVLGSIVGALALCAGAAYAEEAEYEVTFTANWTTATHPLEYPKGNLITGAHFSGVIGATHNGDYSVFKEGMAPSPGLERLSETGKPSPLDQEIKDAVSAGKAGELVQLPPVKNLKKGKSSGMCHVTEAYPMVSLVTMIAPSPDWFAGARVNLMENGKWVKKKTVELYAWDSGGDDGTTYKASDMDTDPKKPTMMNEAPHFMVNGKRKPVATLTFVKK